MQSDDRWFDDASYVAYQAGDADAESEWMARQDKESTMRSHMPNEVLSYLEAFIAENGYAPSVRELQQHFKWASPDTAQRRLRALIDEGKIERVGPRAIRIKDA